MNVLLRSFYACAFACFLCSSAGAAKLTINFDLSTTPLPLSKANLDENQPISIYAISNTNNGVETTKVTDISGTLGSGGSVTLEDGSYLIAPKAKIIEGDIKTSFSGFFFPVLGAVSIKDGSDTQITLKPIVLRLIGCVVQPTEYFAPGYLDKERAAEAKGYKFDGLNSGRVISINGAKGGHCSVDALFPDNAIGPRGLSTYTRMAFVLYDKTTLNTTNYYYSAKAENDHDVMLSGGSPTQGVAGVHIENVLEKSGVYTPWEPFATLSYEPCAVNVSSRIEFRSNDDKPPATLMFEYIYLDDPYVGNSPEDLGLNRCLE